MFYALLVTLRVVGASHSARISPSPVLLYSERKIQERNDAKNGKEVARVLEKLLFARATSLNDYLCFELLDTKLKSVMKALLERKLRKAEQQSSRRLALIKALGDKQKYQHTACLVNEVKRLRTGTQFSGSSLSPLLANSYHSLQERKHSQIPNLLNSKTKLASPVRALFFGTKLVGAFDLTPIKELPAVHWDELISQTERVIEDFCWWTEPAEDQS